MRIRWNLKETENIIYEKKKKKKQRKSQKISGEPHLPLPGQLPLRSGWSRYYRPPTCTEPLKLRESPSAPEVETEEREREEREFQGWIIVQVKLCSQVGLCVRSNSQQSGQWCGCSPPPLHRRGVSPLVHVSWVPSELASLEKSRERWDVARTHIDEWKSLYRGSPRHLGGQNSK